MRNKTPDNLLVNGKPNAPNADSTKPPAIFAGKSNSLPAALASDIFSPISAGKSAAINPAPLTKAAAPAVSGANGATAIPAKVGTPYLPAIPPIGSDIFFCAHTAPCAKGPFSSLALAISASVVGVKAFSASALYSSAAFSLFAATPCNPIDSSG